MERQSFWWRTTASPAAAAAADSSVIPAAFCCSSFFCCLRAFAIVATNKPYSYPLPLSISLFYLVRLINTILRRHDVSDLDVSNLNRVRSDLDTYPDI